MKKYLDFMQVQNPGKKTKIFHIFNKETDEFLGKISWRIGWRQYVSNLEEGIDFSSGCHKEASEFIDRLMEDRK